MGFTSTAFDHAQVFPESLCCISESFDLGPTPPDQRQPPSSGGGGNGGGGGGGAAVASGRSGNSKLPDRWIRCPTHSTLIDAQNGCAFAAFKVRAVRCHSQAIFAPLSRRSSDLPCVQWRATRCAHVPHARLHRYTVTRTAPLTPPRSHRTAHTAPLTLHRSHTSSCTHAPWIRSSTWCVLCRFAGRV
jgi:hypothetical protein